MPDISIDPAIGTLPKYTNTESDRGSQTSAVRDVVQNEPEPQKVEPQTDAEEPRPSPEATREAVEELQSYADRLDRNLEFTVDDSSGRTVVTVRDGSTDEVIRQIPSEEALKLANNIDSGDVSLIDARA